MYGIKKNLVRLWKDESGISSVEYALLLSFVAAAIMLAAEELSNAVGNEMIDAATCMETAGSSGC
jgi:Flp pilus assembly pilin Flp